jgi:dipeptidase E
LGWLTGSNCPHYDGEIERRPAYHRLLKEGKIFPGLATEDSVGAHFINEELNSFISSQPEKNAFFVTVQNRQLIEVAHAAKYLGE